MQCVLLVVSSGIINTSYWLLDGTSEPLLRKNNVFFRLCVCVCVCVCLTLQVTVTDRWYELKPRTDNDHVRGSLRLRLYWTVQPVRCLNVLSLSPPCGRRVSASVCVRLC